MSFIDPIFTQAQNQYNLGQQSLAAEFGDPSQGTYGYQGGQLLQGLGLTMSGEIDVSNPYGRASLLQRSYQQGQTGRTVGHAAAGNLYSSAYQSDMAEGTFQYQRGLSGLHGELQRGLHDIRQTAQERRFELDRGLMAAQAESLGRAPTSGGPGPAPTGEGGASRTHPTQTTSHAAAGLRRVGTNTYIGPNGTYWHRTSAGTFARGRP